MTARHVAKDPWVWGLCGAGLALAVAGAPLSTAGDARAIAQTALASSGALACWAFAGARAARGPAAVALGLSPGRRSVGLADGALLAAGLLGLSHVVDWALHWSGLRTGSQLDALDAALRAAGAGETGWLLVGLVVAPALAEELLFRGLLLGGLQPRLGASWAVAISAALFGLAHLELVHGAAAGLLGVYLGALRVATGSVRLGMACHAINNAAALAALVWLPDFDGASPGLAVGAAACGAAVCLAAVWRIGRLLAPARG